MAFHGQPQRLKELGLRFPPRCFDSIRCCLKNSEMGKQTNNFSSIGPPVLQNLHDACATSGVLGSTFRANDGGKSRPTRFSSESLLSGVSPWLPNQLGRHA